MLRLAMIEMRGSATTLGIVALSVIVIGTSP